MTSSFAHLESVELTDVGRRRKNNEDAVLRLPDHGVFCVADGMGGVQGGEVASKATVDALRSVFSESPDAPFAVTCPASARLVARALNHASQWIKARSDERGLTGSGSTAVVIAFDQFNPSKAVILHAGDSRAYRFRADKLVQLSADHSVAAAAGLPDDKDLPAMFRGVITRAVGLENVVRLEETPTDVLAGDLFLLCSDGLSKMVSDKHLHKLVHKHLDDDLQALAKVLIDEALRAGGEDNVSAVLVRVAKELPPASTQALPPRTLELEAEEVGGGAPHSPSVAYDDEAPTAETGQTVETADGTVGRAERALCQTPVTPASCEGVTPTTAARLPPPSRAPVKAVLLAIALLLLLIVIVLVLFYQFRTPHT